MAEGVEVELPISNQRYFCHLCIQEVSPIYPDLMCPNCYSGFVEEVAQESEDPHTSDESDLDIDAVPPIIEVSLHDLIRRTIRRTILDFEQGETFITPSLRQWLRNGSRQTSRRDEENDASTVLNDADFNDDDEGSLHHLFQLTSNLGDYAFGVEWDAIITQFLNEAEVQGPPPLPKEQIETIPLIRIKKEHIDKGVQCTVCMEDFKLAEEVKCLPCEHFFHVECIVPWLGMHATCPICRKMIKKDENGQASENSARGSLNSGGSEVNSNSSRRSSSSSSVDLGIDFSSLSLHPQV